MDIILSILIPAYNFKKGLDEIIKSLNIIEKKYNDIIEIIISDDSEKRLLDEFEIIKLKERFKYFRYIHNKKRLGGVQNWNKLIYLSKGEYYWLLHHDEFWEKEINIIDTIFKNIIKTHPNFLILPLLKKTTYKLGKISLNLYQKHSSFKKQTKIIIKKPLTLIYINIIGPPSAILISKKYKLYYDTNLKFLVDVDLYIRLFNKTNSKNFLIFERDALEIISSQNNKMSITKLLRSDLKQIRKKEKQKLLLKYNYKMNYSKRFKIIIFYILYKLLCLLNIKIKLNNS